MKRYLTSLFVCLAAFPLSVLAEEGIWQKSYRLETVAKYAEASTVLEGLDEHSFALSRRGWLAYLQGKHNEAVSFYKRALERNPKSLEARTGITLPLMAQRRWREVALYARQILAESTWDYTAHVRLLIAKEGQRDWRGIVDHAKQLVERYPSDATAWVYLARAHAWLGDVSEAKNAYGRVLERYPGHLEAGRYIAKNP